MDDTPDRTTVLVVDDEYGPRESLRMILAPSYRVLQAASGAEAVDIMRTNDVDLVTIDLNMPGMRGEELMRVIRTEFPHVEIIVITGCGSIESAADGIRFGICDYLQKPFDVVQVTAAVMRAVARHTARARLIGFLDELGKVVGHERDAHAILDDVQRSQKLKSRLGGIFEEGGDRVAVAGGGLDPAQTIELLEVLAETIESKDQFMRGHARRVAFFASLLAQRLCLSAEEHQRVRIAAFLHDLGKVGVPTELLLRPDELDAAERARIEMHPAIGARLIQPLDLPATITSAIRHHHEWWDGSGYPDGLSGDEIPLAARIIGVADAVDAMSSDRPYRKALRRDLVLDGLRRFSGVQFDPNLAKEFLAILETGVCDMEPELLAAVVADVRQTAADPSREVAT
jgi:response regulator RpfG family c-di-GMP phosphodiesterase